ncbi:flagellar biosynthesis anti-sigma factor FlgM [Aquisalibacillus elongatus]|uniref:Negative regulator of flagellin synthesis n=1 Tax=Aquisalibacillus elongatus TaxID=485577 RepID=A0A3N5BA41_9BACI|nr:flagellar biosynthesis anti-sigma factor FlgM [Aquisalibacillus elongatus]RPF54354.1 FlgM family anti-sigma-28 factor [Aquisalibacillus elongatus]
MKVNPTNGSNLNVYKQQLQKQDDTKQTQKTQDKIEISNQAKKLQEGNSLVEARQEKVQNLKQQVQDGNYDIDPKKTAEKMIDFWTNKQV